MTVPKNQHEAPEQAAQRAGQKNDDTINERYGYNLDSLAGGDGDKELPDTVREDREQAERRAEQDQP